jgi:hypothetical protein
MDWLTRQLSSIVRRAALVFAGVQESNGNNKRLFN